MKDWLGLRRIHWRRWRRRLAPFQPLKQDQLALQLHHEQVLALQKLQLLRQGRLLSLSF